MPKLFRKTRLGYDATLLCVLLREEFRRFEEEDVHNERCVVETRHCSINGRTFFPPQNDEVRHRRDLSKTYHQVEELGYISKFNNEPETWEIRRILKARLPVAELESLKTQLRRGQPAGRRRYVGAIQWMTCFQSSEPHARISAPQAGGLQLGHLR